MLSRSFSKPVGKGLSQGGTSLFPHSKFVNSPTVATMRPASPEERQTERLVFHYFYNENGHGIGHLSAQIHHKGVEYYWSCEPRQSNYVIDDKIEQKTMEKSDFVGKEVGPSIEQFKQGSSDEKPASILIYSKPLQHGVSLESDRLRREGMKIKTIILENANIENAANFVHRAMNNPKIRAPYYQLASAQDSRETKPDARKNCVTESFLLLQYAIFRREVPEIAKVNYPDLTKATNALSEYDGSSKIKQEWDFVNMIETINDAGGLTTSSEQAT